MSSRIALATASFVLISLVATGCAGFDPEHGHDFDDDRDLAGDDGGDGHEGEDGDGHGGAGHHPGHDGHHEGDGCSDARPHEPGSDPGSDPGAGGQCEAHSTDLIAGQHFDTGSVTISNTADSFELALVADAPYLIVEAHAYVGVDPVPLTNGGKAAPGQFPHQVSFEDPAAEWALSIPLAELEVGCGDELQVAVHATVVSIVDGVEVFEETAWAFGTDELPASWGWSFGYGICCEPSREPELEGCTLTQGFWKTHHAFAEQPALQQPWPIAETTELCGATWLELLDTAPEGDAWLILAHQAIAAELNVASGASTTPEVAAALAGAEAMLSACAIADADQAEALATSELLDAYNNGEVGPGHCG